jgi:hypothetical protein
MTHDEFISEIQQLTLLYRERLAAEVMANLDTAFSGAVPPPKPRAAKPKPERSVYEVEFVTIPAKATTSAVKMSAVEAKKDVERMAKAEGMVVVPGATRISEGHDIKIHPLANVLLSHIKMAPAGIGSGALSRDTGIPGTTVRDHLKKLVAASLIVKNGHGVSVLYYSAARST